MKPARTQVLKEWNHPVSGACFVLPFAVLVLLAFIVEDQSKGLAHALFWMGAPGAMIVSIIKVTRCVYNWLKIYTSENGFAHALFWMGALGAMAVSIIKVTRCVI
jgi:hypothetical protein